MRNVTITLEEEVAQWARIYAAQLDTSVSRVVGEILKEKMRSEENYDVAMNQFFSIAPTPLSADDSPYPRREELHDRKGLR